MNKDRDAKINKILKWMNMWKIWLDKDKWGKNLVGNFNKCLDCETEKFKEENAEPEYLH